jgi:hypothetical protein
MTAWHARFFPTNVSFMSLSPCFRQGLRANMGKLLNLIGDDQFSRCGQRTKCVVTALSFEMKPN